MKKFILTALSVLALALVIAVAYLRFALPKVGEAQDIQVELTPERIQHGEYLALHVAACIDCHSTRDWNLFSGPLVEGTLGKGGEYFGPEAGFPGKFYSKNLTPYHLGDWTDGEIFRAITSGVSKDGTALFPVMPYPYYGKMDKEDVFDIIAYLRSLPSIENDIPASKADFPMSLIINTIPKEAQFTTKPDKENILLYGEYLATVAACVECHTPVKNGQIIPEKVYTGGHEFEMPNGGILRSPNITPDEKTGIGNWTDSTFVAYFKHYGHGENLEKVAANEFNTLMPWAMYADMETNDLEALFAYLKTLNPVENPVVKFSPK